MKYIIKGLTTCLGVMLIGVMPTIVTFYSHWINRVMDSWGWERSAVTNDHGAAVFQCLILALVLIAAGVGMVLLAWYKEINGDN